MDISKKFIAFFEANYSHHSLKSAPLTPIGDKSILFVNSGMAPIKEYFLKQRIPPAKNLSSIQKCMRAGGKHNDLDEVGYSKRHHTFFEMCGNFSFGGYKNNIAIELAYKFLTAELNIDKSKLWVTVHPDDSESYGIWSQIIPEERITKLNENSWSMGDEGPCGKCTEIFYDHGDHLQGDFHDGDRFVEIWNIVIMSQQVKNGITRDLEEICIDTGMGLERIEAVLANTEDNYKAGFFLQATTIIADKTGKAVNHHHKIIADHARAILFMLAEDIEPSNSGRGYVLRRIIRRARLSEKELGADNLIQDTMILASKIMCEHYPEIKTPKLEILQQELNQFEEVCAHGLHQLEKMLMTNPTKLSGADLFKLYDTYGLPLDLARDRTRNVELDLEGFEAEAAHAREKSRTKQTVYQSDSVSKFIGYEHLQTNSLVLDIREDAILLDQTPFYPEGGGQKSDQGIINGSHWTFEVLNVQKQGDNIWHYGKCQAGEAQIGDECKANVDPNRRKGCAQHHSATHLLLAALRKHVGPYIKQKGSSVDINKLRFDFNCNEKFNIDIIERQINTWIQDNYEVKVEYMQKEDAIQMGVCGEFEEKYGDIVRVVTMAESLEFCGGTHVNRTGDIGSFYITKRSSISSGTMRIEGVAGISAYEYMTEQRNILKALSEKFGTPVENLAQLQPKKESQISSYVKQERVHAGISCIFLTSELLSKNLIQDIEKLSTDNNVVIGISFGEKPVIAMKTKIAKIHAVEILNALGFKAGGRADFAQGGHKGPLTEEVFLKKFEDTLHSIAQ